MSEHFDFGDFMRRVSNPDNETDRGMLRDEVADSMEAWMPEVGPRLWCVIYEQMNRDSKNSIHLNAVLDASVFAILSWMAVCTPRGETNGRDNDDILRENIIANLNAALINGRDKGAQIGTIAQSVGKVKLMEDALRGSGGALVVVTQVLRDLQEALKK